MPQAVSKKLLPQVTNFLKYIKENYLLKAVRQGDAAKVRTLLSDPSSRSLINDQDVTGSTPLHYSANLGHEAVTKHLIAGRCKVDIQDGNGDTPLHLAANRGHGAVTKLLIAAGCNVNLTEKHGATPLHVVACFGHADVTMQLIASPRCNINLQTKKGWTPLHNAAYYGNAAVTKQLLEARCNVDLQNSMFWFGNTALQVAELHGHAGIAALIRKNKKQDKPPQRRICSVGGAKSNAAASVALSQPPAFPPAPPPQDKKEMKTPSHGLAYLLGGLTVGTLLLTAFGFFEGSGVYLLLVLVPLFILSLDTTRTSPVATVSTGAEVLGYNEDELRRLARSEDEFPLASDSDVLMEKGKMKQATRTASFPIVMPDRPDVASRDPLEILDLQRLCMGENATPSQLRSLVMSKATDELGGNIISAKDFMSVSQIMEGIDQALSERDFSNGYPDIVGEGLWEMALKLRIQASEAVEAIAVGCLPKLTAILSAHLHGGWSRLAKCSDSSTFAKLKMVPSPVGDGVLGGGDDFFDCLRFAEMAASVLHEICRYRSGEERQWDMLVHAQLQDKRIEDLVSVSAAAMIFLNHCHSF